MIGLLLVCMVTVLTIGFLNSFLTIPVNTDWADNKDRDETIIYIKVNIRIR